MAKAATAKKNKPLSKSEILNAVADAVGEEVSRKHVKAGRRDARRRRSQGAEEERHLRAPRLREVRRREEARAPRARGHQPVHEGEADVRREAREQGRPRAAREGDQGRGELTVTATPRGPQAPEANLSRRLR